MGKPLSTLHTAAPSVVEYGSQHRHSRSSRSPRGMHKTQALSSVTSGWQGKNSISVKFLSLLTSTHNVAFLKIRGCRCNV